MEEWDGGVGLTRMGRSASLARLEVCFGLPAMLLRPRRQQFDLLRMHAPNPTMLLALGASRPATPFVVTHHSDVVKQKYLGLALRPFEHLVFGQAASIITTSSAYAAGSDQLRAYRAKVCVLPFGVNLRPARVRPLRQWVLVLIGWTAVMFLMPLQHFLVQLVGLRGNAFLVPFLLFGGRLKARDVNALAVWLAVLNCVALSLGGAEYFLGVPKFYPLNAVTAIIYNSNDAAGYTALRIPACFANAHSYSSADLATTNAKDLRRCGPPGECCAPGPNGTLI